MTEEEVLNLKLPEHLGYNLDILFVSVLCMHVRTSNAEK